ncbi:hypothetical protein AB0D10_32035 [Kitasatospora sp. NPDC048545]|uniref:hypothetical protein n=1 Tax=Kitasatospora sp. NPDC048545 TaxID=3157208 RepID=UPI0033DCDCE9
MTDLADVLGVMVSEQAARADRAARANRGTRPDRAGRADRPHQSDPTEKTQVLRTQPRALEARSNAPARHGQFLESLLAGQAPLSEEPHREGR